MSASLENATMRRAELWLAYLLRSGVILSASVIAFGIWLLFFHPSAVADFSGLKGVLSGDFSASLSPPMTLASFRAGLQHLDPFAVGSLGLMLLILLPVTRVAFTVVFFLIEKDFLYFFVTAFVLAVLLSSLLLGKEL